MCMCQKVRNRCFYKAQEVGIHTVIYKIACFACFYHIKIVQNLIKKQPLHNTFYILDERKECYL